VIDASGVGRAFSSTLDEAQIPHMAVQMTAGANAVRAGRFWNVGKSVLLTDLAGALENGTLSILKRLPLKDLLLEELASFETKTTAAGNSVLASTAKTSHADMATALALAWFATERAGGFVGEGKLAGWY
jgi:hypothetical protein